jgi:hypothetical protein
MQSGRLSGELLIWKGSPLALVETQPRDIEPEGDSLAGDEEMALAPPQGGESQRKWGRWLAAVGIAFLAVSGTAGLVLAPTGNKAAPPAAAAIPVPPAAAKLAADALDPALRPPPLKPAAIALPQDEAGNAAPSRMHLARPLAQPTKPAGATPRATVAGEGSPTDAPPATENSLPAKATPPPAPAITAIAAASSEWRARGDTLFVAGDLVPARQFYELAANAGDGQAALQLGETYDPAFLAKVNLTRERGDASTAAHWYKKASKLGAPDAELLLKAVMAEAVRPSSQ